jgi:hypothetical protein
LQDAEVLALAAAEHRVLVSHDVGTMPAHFRAFRDAGRNSCGVFLIPQSLDVGTAITPLRQRVNRSTDDFFALVIARLRIGSTLRYKMLTADPSFGFHPEPSDVPILARLFIAPSRAAGAARSLRRAASKSPLEL